ncbi:hypothetical protein AVEN_185541-1, partial [Araneus ventricosus]
MFDCPRDIRLYIKAVPFEIRHQSSLRLQHIWNLLDISSRMEFAK